ncbi:amidohydrolase family protein [Sphingosinicella sp. CPCC 101087]|uniref:amidohydrolase family protein n=1 Tax=Sphingosinicella sp. CPCC 101087 TaxID=2497754 RepID=UPI00101B66CD|nr:amidohydrolase family protein [Sphingosinicella sp. CPCC 101087]
MPASRLSNLFGLLLALVLGACSTAEADEPGGTVLTNFTLIDGTERPPVPDAAMIIGGDGRIAWVGPATQLQAPAGSETIDLAGQYVIPGLIDLHVHLAISDGLATDPALLTPENIERDLRTYAAYGVTAVQVMGTDRDDIYAIRDAQRTGRPESARIFTSGQGIVFEGGYGGAPGVNRPVSTPEEAAAEVDRQAANGADFIKFWVDDELGTMPAMPPEISAAVIEAAHRHGLRAIAHIFYLEDAKRLVEQGVDGLAHGVRDRPVDAELIEAMRDRGTWQVAETLSREASMFAYGEPAPFLGDPFFTRSVRPEVLARLRSPEHQARIASNPHFHDFPRFLEMAKTNLRRLADGGVRIGFGTDSGPISRFPGYFAHWELQQLVDAGFTPAEAIRMATGQAAEFLRAEDLGTLEPGHWADLVVLEADPLADISNSRTIRSVYIAGRPVPLDLNRGAGEG